ncbi:MAG: expansin EXLX1 family cellulose-binding protein [Gallionella sp.]|nr:expansin EXLX1 family cellulose-binding protein [Gallionella sp.]
MFFRLFILWLCCSAAYAEDTTVAQQHNSPVHQGISSYYKATGKGQCSFDANAKDLMVAAVNRRDYNKAALCGAYLRVKGSKGEVVVRVVDGCPGCKAGGLDLSKQAFAQVADLRKGRERTTWQIESPLLETPVQYRFKKGSNAFCTSVQILNHRNPIAKLEFQNSEGIWVAIPRMAYNYFVQKKPRMGAGPYTFRVTDFYGNSLVDKDIPLKTGVLIAGTQQFPTSVSPTP